VDREEMDGRHNIEKLCPQVEALINRSEVIERYKKSRAQGAKRKA
jgi:hypothetical protein